MSIPLLSNSRKFQKELRRHPRKIFVFPVSPGEGLNRLLSLIGLVATRESSPASGLWWLCSWGREEVMLAARKSFLAVLLVLTLCLIGSTPTYSQRSTIFSASKPPSNRTKSGAWLAKCNASSMNTFAAAHLSEVSAGSPVGNATARDFNVPTAPDAPCVESAPLVTPRAPSDNPCPENVVGA